MGLEDLLLGLGVFLEATVWVYIHARIRIKQVLADGGCFAVFLRSEDWPHFWGRSINSMAGVRWSWQASVASLIPVVDNSVGSMISGPRRYRLSFELQWCCEVPWSCWSAWKVQVQTDLWGTSSILLLLNFSLHWAKQLPALVWFQSQRCQFWHPRISSTTIKWPSNYQFSSATVC